jgi:hypothetical protein
MPELFEPELYFIKFLFLIGLVVFVCFLDEDEAESIDTTKCCCRCSNNLHEDESFVIENGCIVIYKCKKCGAVSEWLFSAPAPVLLKMDGKTVRYERKLRKTSIDRISEGEHPPSS